MSFAWPLALLALLAVPLAAAGYLLAQQRPSRYAVAYTNIEVLAAVVTRGSSWRRHAPAALFLLALVAVTTAFARPQVAVMKPREDATVVLAIDSSGSMGAADVEPTRMGAAQRAIRRFLQNVPERFNVGLVTFGGDVTVAAPPTTDRALVMQALEFMYPLRGTAIGDAVARSVEVGRDAVGGPSVLADTRAKGDESPVAILMLSDGSQTTGWLEPLQGAQRAKRLGIPVYTIALGTPEGVIEFDFGDLGRIIPVPPDPATLRAIAETTGGKFFDAPSAEALLAAYDAIGSQISRERGRMEVTFALLGAGALLAGAAGLLARLWGPRLP